MTSPPPSPSTIYWGIAGTGPKSEEFVEAIFSTRSSKLVLIIFRTTILNDSFYRIDGNHICAISAPNLAEATNFAKKTRLLPSPDDGDEKEDDDDESNQDEPEDIDALREVDPPKLYSSFKDLAQDKKVMAVYVNTPEHQRVKVSQMMLNNGGAVLSYMYCTVYCTVLYIIL